MAREPSQTSKLTSAAINARDFQRARKDREIRAHLPEGTLVAIAGGKQMDDAGAIIRHLEKLKAKYDDVILVHGGGPGVEKIAARWAEQNGVHQMLHRQPRRPSHAARSSAEPIVDFGQHLAPHCSRQCRPHRSCSNAAAAPQRFPRPRIIPPSLLSRLLAS